MLGKRTDLQPRDRLLVVTWIVATLVAVLALGCAFALARDDGRFANSLLKAWFNSLASGKGLCCSFADGVAIEDVDWGTEAVTVAGKSTITYWVMLNGKKIVVPPDAVVTVPNKFGRAVVWPYQDGSGATQIRCFLPGAGA